MKTNDTLAKAWKPFNAAQQARKNSELLSVPVLAWRYADRMLETGQTVAHVFPVGRSERSHAAIFRLHLAQALSFGRRSRAGEPMWRGSQYVYRARDLRTFAESRLAAHGFAFEEVDPAEYAK